MASIFLEVSFGQSEEAFHNLTISVADLDGNNVDGQLPEEILVTADVAGDASFIAPVGVQYFIDDVLIGGFSSDKLPGKFPLNVSGISSGVHTLTVSFADQAEKKARGSVFIDVGVY